MKSSLRIELILSILSERASVREPIIVIHQHDGPMLHDGFHISLRVNIHVVIPNETQNSAERSFILIPSISENNMPIPHERERRHGFTIDNENLILISALINHIHITNRSHHNDYPFPIKSSAVSDSNRPSLNLILIFNHRI